ncbi:Acetyltransferase (isoleucine patch superfamily) [Nocardioides alpinus]|uniref:Acetyltransferase (Isoleucine patch superfamily) n=1 Tax=Nocardioides alpinus TaxID=748909 RepID=A0A1I0W3R4_9ACTN|nr:acyltransferase [Nocardioides alpinus]SFA83272.1 Acetyltransferase (isoleucine patch superfamily) [Nocardioides alpinus]
MPRSRAALLATILFRARSGARWRVSSFLSRRIYPSAFGAFGAGSVLDRPKIVLGADRIRIGEGCVIARDAWLACEEGGGPIDIGDEVSFAPGVHLHAADPITIGARCSFAESVYVGSADHDPRDHASIRGSGPVVIGDDCFIGLRAVILGGVNVGAGAVIGAHAVVTKDVPAGAVVSGVPARQHAR